MSSKHVKNFAELFENLKEVSTDELITLAESGIVSWITVTEKAFASGDLAVIYWVQVSAYPAYHLPVIIFRSGRTISGEAVRGDTRTEATRAKANKLAYGAGAKMTIDSNSISIVSYDEGRRSAKVPTFLAKDIVLAAREFLKANPNQ